MAIRRTRLDRLQEGIAGSQIAGRGTFDPEPQTLVVDGGDLDLPMDLIATLADAISGADLDAPDDLVYVFKTQHDDRVRPSHAALHDTQWNADDPDRPIPPLDWGCRCYLELQAKTPEAAERTGLDVAQKRPPEPGADALKDYFKGTSATPEDILGKTVGKLVEDKRLPWDYALDEQGNAQPATVAQGLAKATTPAQRRIVERAMFRLSGMGIQLAQVRQIVAQARVVMRETGVTAKKALAQVIVDRKPGFIPSRDSATTLRRADAAARLILDMYGGGLG